MVGISNFKWTISFYSSQFVISFFDNPFNFYSWMEAYHRSIDAWKISHLICYNLYKKRLEWNELIIIVGNSVASCKIGILWAQNSPNLAVCHESNSLQSLLLLLAGFFSTFNRMRTHLPFKFDKRTIEWIILKRYFNCHQKYTTTASVELNWVKCIMSSDSIGFHLTVAQHIMR